MTTVLALLYFTLLASFSSSVVPGGHPHHCPLVSVCKTPLLCGPQHWGERVTATQSGWTIPALTQAHIHPAMVWTCVPPQNSHAEALAFSVMVLGGEAFGVIRS